MQVNHSQRLSEKPLDAWVIANKDGQIQTAHCNCITGCGETCTHVAAMLFKAEAAVKIRRRTTVTDVPAYWMLLANVEKVCF